MERVSVVVVVEEADFDDGVVTEDVGVRVNAVDNGVVGERAGSERGVKGRNYLCKVGNVVHLCSEGGLAVCTLKGSRKAYPPVLAVDDGEAEADSYDLVG